MRPFPLTKKALCGRLQIGYRSRINPVRLKQRVTAEVVARSLLNVCEIRSILPR